MALPIGRVVQVAADKQHNFSKKPVREIRLLKDLGVEGDAHCGKEVKHRSRVAINPDQPNLRQVHLFAVEILDELSKKGFPVKPAELGENITTSGLDYDYLPKNTLLMIGESARLLVTGLRNPCRQIDTFQPGLKQNLISQNSERLSVFRAGIMAIVLEGGDVRCGDKIIIELPPLPHQRLERI
jgi:MOSC domain-containing protein YiiM